MFIFNQFYISESGIIPRIAMALYRHNKNVAISKYYDKIVYNSPLTAHYKILVCTYVGYYVCCLIRLLDYMYRFPEPKNIAHI